MTKLTLDSPLKQIKAGIPLDEIKCKDEFVLAIKNSDDSSVCVKPKTKTKPIERGWTRG